VCSGLTRPCGGQCISIWTPPPVIPCPSMTFILEL
jgi:hypothetical protein